MPFHSNAWLTREKEIRYGTRLKKMPPITFIPRCSRINVKRYQLFVSENIAWIRAAWVELYEETPGIKCYACNAKITTCLSYLLILLIV